VNVPVPFATATAHEGKGISDRATSYFGINIVVTDNNLYSDLNFEFLLPLLWAEGKWSSLETDKHGEYISGSIQKILTTGENMVNVYLGPSIFGYNFRTNAVTDSYFGIGLTSSLTYTKDGDNIPLTLMLSMSSTTDGNLIFINPKFTFLSYEIFPDLTGIHFNVLMSISYNYSKEYSYYDTGMSLGILF